MLFLQEFCNTLESSPPTSPPLEKPEVTQEVKQETAKKDKSVTESTAPSVATDISAIEDILQLLNVLYGISTNSAYDFGEGGKDSLQCAHQGCHLAVNVRTFPWVLFSTRGKFVCNLQ